jgi:membrane-associated protease RseP (regulator of RpoE activity)
MDTTPDYTVWDSYIRRIFAIEDFTIGSAKEPYLVRYRGHLVAPDSAQAYDQLAASLQPLGLTPLFRVEEGQHIILIQKSAPEPKTSRPLTNLVMFILTLISVIASGALTSIETLPRDPLQAVLLILKTGWPFAVSLLAILGAHEFGHYLVGRAHGSNVTLPFFIPMPFTAFGTMGAFISMKEAPKNKRTLMDIAVAGPIAGFVVSLVVIMIGLSLSNLDRIPTILSAGQGFQIEGNSLTYLFLKYLRFGQLLPQPLSYGDTAPWLYWIKYFFTAHPFPLGGLDVMIHPVAWAGWAGLLVTSLNLIPAGQLDGGHVFYLLFGKKKAAQALPFIIAALAGLGFLWSGWWLWAGIIFFLGRVYAEPRDQITELDRPRKILGVVALILFLVTFSTVPITLVSG